MGSSIIPEVVIGVGTVQTALRAPRSTRPKSKIIRINSARAVEVPVSVKPDGVDQKQWDVLCRINDAMVSRVRYDHVKAQLPHPVIQTPRETLRRNLGSCMDFAVLFESAARKVGIEAKSLSSESLNHAWNAVRLNGVWWSVDVTWNAGDTFANGDEIPAQVRNDVDVRRWYLLSSPESETAMFAHGLTKQTHLVKDVRVNLTRTLHAMAIIARIEELLERNGQSTVQIPSDKQGPISRLYKQYRQLQKSYPLAVRYRLTGGPTKATTTSRPNAATQRREN